MSPRSACVVLSIASLLWGCASQLQCKNPDGPETCAATGGAGDAAGASAAAGALWIAGGGCNIAGCRPPMTCNPRTGYCEHLTCGEGKGRCPDGTRCDSETQTCR